MLIFASENYEQSSNNLNKHDYEQKITYYPNGYGVHGCDGSTDARHP